jgi:adenylylsulfate kinase
MTPGECTCPPGATVWLTGLPSAGKTTIADTIAVRLRQTRPRVEVLDGDHMRATVSPGLGFSRADRDRNVERIGLIAELLARHDVLVLVPVIAPYADSREMVRKRHEQAGVAFLEIHVATPVAVCAQRDVKGLYARQAAGTLTALTGVDDPYEAPKHPDLRIETHRQTITESVTALHTLLTRWGLTSGRHPHPA